MAGTQIIFGDKVFKDRLSYISRYVFKEVRQEAIDIAHDVRNEILSSMQTTPRDMNKKRSRQFKRSSRTKKRQGELFHYPSLPGNPPAIDSGELIGDIKVSVRRKEVEVGDVSQLHGEAMEKGVKKRNIEPRPWMKPAIKKEPIKSRIAAAFKRGGDLR